MDGNRRKVLVISGRGETDSGLLRFLLPALVRFDCDVERIPPGSNILEFIERNYFDLIVIGFPIEQPTLPALLKSVRWRESACRNSAVLVVTDRVAKRRAEDYRGRGFNRMVLDDATEWELEGAIRELLEVEPRVPLSVPARLDLPLGGQVERVVAQIDNLSTSGMLVRGRWVVEIGSPVTFELTLPGETKSLRGLSEVVRPTVREREGVVGFALQFVRFDGDGRQRLERFVERQRVQGAAERPGTARGPVAEAG